VIPDRAFDEARSWLAKAQQSNEKALKDLEISMGGYGMPDWAKQALAEEILALIRLKTEKTSGSDRKD
jgi:hypothetical protein